MCQVGELRWGRDASPAGSERGEDPLPTGTRAPRAPWTARARVCAHVCVCTRVWGRHFTTVGLSRVDIRMQVVPVICTD